MVVQSWLYVSRIKLDGEIWMMCEYIRRQSWPVSGYYHDVPEKLQRPSVRITYDETEIQSRYHLRNTLGHYCCTNLLYCFLLICIFRVPVFTVTMLFVVPRFELNSRIHLQRISAAPIVSTNTQKRNRQLSSRNRNEVTWGWFLV